MIFKPRTVALNIYKTAFYTIIVLDVARLDFVVY